MKRWPALLLLLTGIVTNPARAGTVGVGAFSGIHVPIVQDDDAQGTSFGLRVPVALHRFLTVEPYFATTKDGDATQTIGRTDYTRTGFDIQGFGANVLLTVGSGFQFYPYATVGSHRMTRTSASDQTATGFGGGLGFGIALAPKFRIHVRAQGERLASDGSSRFFASATAGLTYTLTSFAAK